MRIELYNIELLRTTFSWHENVNNEFFFIFSHRVHCTYLKKLFIIFQKLTTVDETKKKNISLATQRIR